MFNRNRGLIEMVVEERQWDLYTIWEENAWEFSRTESPQRLIESRISKTGWIFKTHLENLS